jgi:biotin-dependent carboxylase-like uncharacterized protein
LSLIVRALAGAATIQDGGRFGWRRYGVPPSGIWDRESAALANALVGNSPATPVIEMALGTIELEACDDFTLAWVGGRSDGRRCLSPGEILRIGPPTRARLYLAAPGGFAAPPIMGSPAGTPVGVGSTLSAARRWYSAAALADPPSTLRPLPFRLLPGPQADRFDLDEFAGRPYQVHILSDRVGIRLEGAALADTDEIVSEPACPGAIQVSGSGQPIILGPDGPTIGGYPKIAVVCEADLDRLAQLRPGDPFLGEWISAEQAQALARDRAARLERRLAAVRLSLRSG